MLACHLSNITALIVEVTLPSSDYSFIFLVALQSLSMLSLTAFLFLFSKSTVSWQ